MVYVVEQLRSGKTVESYLPATGQETEQTATLQPWQPLGVNVRGLKRGLHSIEGHGRIKTPGTVSYDNKISSVHTALRIGKCCVCLFNQPIEI